MKTEYEQFLDTMTPEKARELKEYMASIGRRGGCIGGKVRSPSKIAAARANGKLGGQEATTVFDKFQTRLVKTDTCWFLRDAPEGKYTCLSIGRKHSIQAHRLSWEMHYGPIPEGMDVCHNCLPNPDNKACVNPDHLWIGTRKENIQDYWSKKRGKKISVR